LGDVVEKFAPDREGTAGERDLRLAVRADVLDMITEQARDMRGVRWRGDGDDGFRFRNLAGGGEDRRTAKAVADQDRGGLPRRPQTTGGADEIGDVGGEGRVGEIALARAEPGEVEAQRRDAPARQRDRNAPRRQHILPAGEAMRKQRVGRGLAVRKIKRGREPMAAFTFELELLGRHMSLRSTFPWIALDGPGGEADESIVRIALLGPGIAAVVIA